MEQSKQYQEILALGKKLVKIFDKPDDEDFTLKWISNYLAENIISVEKETDKKRQQLLQSEICTTILDIWERRRNFPPGYIPLENFAPLVEILESFDHNSENYTPRYYQRFQEFENLGTWGKYLFSLRQNIERSIEIAIRLVANKEKLQSEANWKDHLELLTEEENKYLDLLDTAIENGSQNGMYQIIVKYIDEDENKPESSRIDKAFKTLREMHQKQGRALDDFENLFRNAVTKQDYNDQIEE